MVFFRKKAGIFRWVVVGLLFGSTMCPKPAIAQKEYSVLQNWFAFRSEDNGLYRHLLAQALPHLEERSKAVSRLKTTSEWQTYQKKIRKTLLDAIGPFPGRTPLNAKTLRTLRKEGFRIEHLLFESQPGFVVTASLFVPEPLNGKAPGIVYCSGHSPTGYKAGAYQQVLLNLVKKGFVVLAFDPAGQGERLEYPDTLTGKSKVGQPTREHDMPGVQTFISGSCQARYMMWDGIRAVDYLLSRPEVDPARIGMTGRSGGGTQTAFIGALDDRILATAPECYLTNFTRLLQSLGPSDAEQNLPNIIGRNFDEPDFLIARAPKPTLMITTLNDYFNQQGSRDTYLEVSRAYTAFGKSGKFGKSEDFAGHASTRKNREAMYAFFQRELQNPGSAKDDSVAFLSADEMRVTPTGLLATSLGSETVFSLNRTHSDKLLNDLEIARKNPGKHLAEAIGKAKRLSGFRTPDMKNQPVYMGVLHKNGLQAEKYLIKGEGDYVIPYLLFVPPQPNGKAILYLSPKGKGSIAGNPLVTEWVKGGNYVMMPDLIGTGETGPGPWKGGDYFEHFPMEGLGYDLWYGFTLIGRSLVGVRAADVVRLVQVLKASGATEIGAIAMREQSPVLLHAAAFEPLISRVLLLNPYTSYHSLNSFQYYNPDFVEGAVPAALTAYDLPDLAASLAPRKLGMVNPINGKADLLSEGEAEKELGFVRTVYKDSKSEGFRIITGSMHHDEALRDFYADWVRLKSNF